MTYAQQLDVRTPVLLTLCLSRVPARAGRADMMRVRGAAWCGGLLSFFKKMCMPGRADSMKIIFFARGLEVLRFFEFRKNRVRRMRNL